MALSRRRLRRRLRCHPSHTERSSNLPGGPVERGESEVSGGERGIASARRAGARPRLVPAGPPSPSQKAPCHPSHPERSSNLLGGPVEGGESEVSGGERGIRTLDGLLTHTPLAGVRLRPLGHLSVRPQAYRTDLAAANGVRIG